LGALLDNLMTATRANGDSEASSCEDAVC